MIETLSLKELGRRRRARMFFRICRRWITRKVAAAAAAVTAASEVEEKKNCFVHWSSSVAADRSSERFFPWMHSLGFSVARA